MREIRKRHVVKGIDRDGKQTFASDAVDARAMAPDVSGTFHPYGTISSMGWGQRPPARTSGTLNEPVPPRSIATGERPTRNAKAADLEPLKPIRWRTRIPRVETRGSCATIL
jgi:hypothetical protein